MSNAAGYSDVDLDALREVANIGAGAAATELYRYTGSSVSLELPNSRVLRFREVLDAFGDAETVVTAIVVEVAGDVRMLLALLMRPEDLASLQPPGASELAIDELLVDIGERLCGAFAHSIADLTGLRLSAHVAGSATDMLGAIVQSLVAPVAGDQDRVLLVDLDLDVQHLDTEVRLLCAPHPDSVRTILRSLGIESNGAT